MKNIAVFFGGVSVEHDVSIITGALTVNSLDKEQFLAVPVYVDKNGKWYTGERLNDIDEYKNLNVKRLKQVLILPGTNRLCEIKGKKLKELCAISVAINCMHGERGEDGSLAGLLNMCDIPLVSPAILASSVCMDKCFTKTVMKGLKVKTLPYAVVDGDTDLISAVKKLGYPVIVKPACLGSSIGVKRADNYAQLIRVVQYALQYGERVIIEKCLDDFTEINCAVYRGENGEIKVSECERPEGKSSILSFDDKYLSGKRVFPADIDSAISDKIKAITERVYRELYVNGVIRIDYFISDGVIYLNEVNTVPGSLSYYLFGDTLKSFTKMLTTLIQETERRYNRNSTIKKSFKTSILSMTGAKGQKRL